MAVKSRHLSLRGRGLNFEMLMWAFTRFSALAMYGLILFALIGALVMGARMHMNFADVMRWAYHAQRDPCAGHEPAGRGALGHGVLEVGRYAAWCWLPPPMACTGWS